jgi:hypothetical protein
VLSYDEEGRLVRISRLQNGVTTPLFEYGYGYDGARRWRKDLASNVWDWYPCGVACCAGDLATLRSTDGGATWSVLERRLDQAPVVNGEPFLGALGSGTRRIGAEAALADDFGVSRHGAYGPLLNSLLRPFRGDESVEQNLEMLGLLAAGARSPACVAPAFPQDNITFGRDRISGLACMCGCLDSFCPAKQSRKCVKYCSELCFRLTRVPREAACKWLWELCHRMKGKQAKEMCLLLYGWLCAGA